MEDNLIIYNDYTHLLTQLTEAFSELQPGELRDLLFFLQEFRKEHVIPKDTRYYSLQVPVEGLEVADEDKISEILVEGVSKYEDLKYPEKNLPPVVAVKTRVRQIIVYGEQYAIEAYLRKFSLRAIMIDIGKKNPFEIFNIKEEKTAFLVPIVQERVKNN